MSVNGGGRPDGVVAREEGPPLPLPFRTCKGLMGGKLPEEGDADDETDMLDMLEVLAASGTP